MRNRAFGHMRTAKAQISIQSDHDFHCRLIESLGIFSCSSVITKTACCRQNKRGLLKKVLLVMP